LLVALERMGISLVLDVSPRMAKIKRLLENKLASLELNGGVEAN
jgi:hypothetical protein